MSSVRERLMLTAVLVVVGARITMASPTAWYDAATGFAIGGFDPVAYFTEAAPHRGAAKHEYTWRGAVFRFANLGNMAAFARDPLVYAPQFGGYDAYALSQGVAAEGEPTIWTVDDDRLYLFESADNRDRWVRDRQRLTYEALRRWQTLAETIPTLAFD